jgi:hypothetical protein
MGIIKGYRISMMSPIWLFVWLILPAGSSMAIRLAQAMGLRRLGDIFWIILIICIFLFKNSTSMEKRIKKVWIEEHGLRIKASLAERLSCPRSPFIL